MATVDEYLADITPSQKAQYGRIRKIVKLLVPEADEVISYGMPTFKYRGKYLIYFGAFKNHMSVFPGTIKFTEENPIPELEVKKIVLGRLEEINRG